MNWPDERYVRLYVRKTAEWTSLCWQARALHALLLKECDRAGVIEVPGGPRRGKMLAGLVGMPLEVFTPGIEELLEVGWVIESSVGFVWPHFIEAQETPASPRQRTAECRARHRDLRRLAALRAGEGCNVSLHDETKRLESVTPYRAVPSLREGRGADAAPLRHLPRRAGPAVAVVSGKKKTSKNFLQTTTTPLPPRTPEQLRVIGLWDAARADAGMPSEKHNNGAQVFENMDSLIARAVHHDPELGWVAMGRMFHELLRDPTFHSKKLSTAVREKVYEDRLASAFSALRVEWEQAEKTRRRRRS